MFSTDVYKIVNSDEAGVCFDRPILPNALIFGVIASLAVVLIYFVWDDPSLNPWFWFGFIALALMILGLLYLLIPDKRITLEENGSKFLLKGKHWLGKRNGQFAADGVMTIVTVTGSEGNRAMNYVLEVRTYDGLRFMLGFHGYGSFKREKLKILGQVLEEKSGGRLTLES